MTPLTDPAHGFAVFLSAQHDLPDKYPFWALAISVRNGKSIVWVEGKNTLVVTTTNGPTTLFIDLVVSKTAGALQRNLPRFLSFMDFSDIRYLECCPLGDAQARLYRRIGFTGSNERLTYDREITNG